MQHKRGDEDECNFYFFCANVLQSAPGRGGDPRLESALLFFVSQFRKMYVSEQAMSTNSRLYARLAERIGIADDAMVMNMIITKMYARRSPYLRTRLPFKC